VVHVALEEFEIELFKAVSALMDARYHLNDSVTVPAKEPANE
jgi:hypothetical protein